MALNAACLNRVSARLTPRAFAGVSVPCMFVTAPRFLSASALAPAARASPPLSCRFFSSAIPPANAAALADPLPATPAAPAVFGSLSGATARAGAAQLKNVHEVATMEEYEAAVYGESKKKPVVCLFSARFSLQSKLLLQPFAHFAASASNNAIFLLVDCDRVPRAAYHARVESVPSIAVLKDDDAFRQLITDKVGEKTPADLIQETRSALDQVLRLDQQEGGTKLQPGVSSYTHHIGVDNLNVHRVGWPVA
ncbi:hypothetical protein BESB_013780 [Besnoitia besnoiti]|uniref:Thioredoxin domain-containing protein n=1 Tax=Besnoitia besnoiti TaxID=94643 RepID=A0A2A9MA08_BESBE|nr:hypothetical protein BESB_013780 [Besnoitia besnoiti]PFH32766.1 hypothetical protein BESB_013780 [Besnoitia besnoiti]